jgi:N-acetylmuramoyl-L-alanine amidase
MTDKFGIPVWANPIPSHAVLTLAQTAWGEARGEGIAGMLAVIHVVLNRVRHAGGWGTDIVSVCMHPKQFSCWNENDPNREQMLRVPTTDVEFSRALVLAQWAVAGELVGDPTNGAVNYYAHGIAPPYWALGLSPCAIIGNHLFFRAPAAVSLATA